MLPSRREHRFLKISVSAAYLDFDLEITTPGNPNGAQDASEASPKRSQTLSETLFRRLWGSLGGLLGELGLLERPRGGPGAVLVPFGTHFTSILDHFAPHVGPIFHVLGAILNEFSLKTFFAGRETRKRHQRHESTSETEEASRREGRRDPEGYKIFCTKMRLSA